MQTLRQICAAATTSYIIVHYPSANKTYITTAQCQPRNTCKAAREVCPSPLNEWVEYPNTELTFLLSDSPCFTLIQSLPVTVEAGLLFMGRQQPEIYTHPESFLRELETIRDTRRRTQMESQAEQRKSQDSISHRLRNQGGQEESPGH